jgi:hypothetical protein
MLFSSAKGRTVSVLILVCAAFSVSAATAGKADEAKATYLKLVLQAETGDTSVDFQALRKAAFEGSVAGNFDVQARELVAMKALQMKQWSAALTEAKEVIQHDFSSMDAHFVAFIASRELGKDEDAKKQDTLVRGLVGSILRSGDGKSAKTAWTVYRVHEEYFVLRVLGLTPGSQGYSKSDGHSFDHLTSHDPQTGKDRELWFNVDADSEELDSAFK